MRRASRARRARASRKKRKPRSKRSRGLVKRQNSPYALHYFVKQLSTIDDDGAWDPLKINMKSGLEMRMS